MSIRWFPLLILCFHCWVIADINITAFVNLMLKLFIADDFEFIVPECCWFFYKSSVLIAIICAVYISTVAPLCTDVRISESVLWIMIRLSAIINSIYENKEACTHLNTIPVSVVQTHQDIVPSLLTYRLIYSLCPLV